jgi:hypothetical protein
MPLYRSLMRLSLLNKVEVETFAEYASADESF